MEKRAYRNSLRFLQGFIAPLAAYMHSATASKEIICSQSKEISHGFEQKQGIVKHNSRKIF